MTKISPQRRVSINSFVFLLVGLLTNSELFSRVYWGDVNAKALQRALSAPTLA